VTARCGRQVEVWVGFSTAEIKGRVPCILKSSFIIHPLRFTLMKLAHFLFGSLAFVMSAHGQDAPHRDDIPVITVSPGVELKELIGRSGKPGAKTDQASVALFHLDAGRASAWSYNKIGEESFVVLKGSGEVWMGNRAHAVRAGSFILVSPSVVRSVRASKGEALEFYAITTPAWTSADDVLTAAPAGAPQ
jgi:mannose-6-phosphate isomerase-like protein (cupin superfamily)